MSSSSKAAKVSSVVLITGASKGIGLAFAKYYSEIPGVLVIAGCREPQYASELVVLRNVQIEQLDVVSDASVQALAAKITAEHGTLDLLINNAGIGFQDAIDDPQVVQNAKDQIETNALGPLRMMHAFLPLIQSTPGSKIVNITSRLGSIGDNSSGKFYGYRASKAALNALTVSMARDVKDHPIFVLHPGMVRTSMSKGQGDIDADEAVAKMAKVIANADIKDSGRFFHRDGQELPW